MKLPIKFDEILLPKKGIDMEKWCIVACDQYTSQPEYWHELERYTKGSPSTLNLIYPECFLEENTKERIDKIISNMNEYLKEGIFDEQRKGAILVERKTPLGNTRYGLMMLVDLTQYSFNPSDKALIRATEGTVIERIPPRVEIRKNCPLEFPHILLLIDDKKRTVIEPLINKNHELVYDTELNMDGGHIRGYHISDTKSIENALESLLEESISKYGEQLLFAVGDGNHSLATAKACYKEDNPLSRYALVEVENIYDEGIIFEPIHRVFYTDKRDLFIEKLNEIGGKTQTSLYNIDKKETLNIPDNSILAVDLVQKAIDSFIKEYGGRVDYIHGEKDLIEICKKTNGIGIVLKPMDKGDLFAYVVKNGVLPRKTFSMGEANEKRYYIEGRKIK